MTSSNSQIEHRLSGTAGELRTSDCSRSVIGSMFLRYASHRFGKAHQESFAERIETTRRLPSISAALHRSAVCFTFPRRPN